MDLALKVTIITSVIGGLKWVYEYSNSNRWERNKFLLEKINEFESKDFITPAYKMLDWNSIRIDWNGQSYLINDDILVEALKTHNIKKTFTKDETIIREIFDKYFDELNKLVVLSELKLVDKSGVESFIGYYLDILRGKRGKDKVLVDTFKRYLKYYNYNKLYKFIYE